MSKKLKDTIQPFPVKTCGIYQFKMPQDDKALLINIWCHNLLLSDGNLLAVNNHNKPFNVKVILKACFGFIYLCTP